MKTWNDGKLENKNTKEIESFLSGKDILLDQKLVKWDILSTIAHELMLEEMGFLNLDELKQILTKLLDIYNNGIKLESESEDVHSNIESKLIEDLGEVGKKVHTAISRNEQIIVDLQLYMKNGIICISKMVLKLGKTISKLAIEYQELMMPGYTHHQQAMPYTFGSFLMSHFYSLMDDLEILQFAYSFVDKNPLGSGAGYGLPVEVNKELTTKLLGFDKISNNSLYMINNRGKYGSIVIFALSQLMLDLNKLSQDLIMFSMKEFGFIDLPEEYCTGSSIMPQKKNPDTLELIKGKTSSVVANLFQNFLCMKNLPSGYNRDLQESKPSLIGSIDITKKCLTMMNGILSKIEVNESVIKESLSNEIFATHHAVSLTKKGTPYKEAYKIIGKKLRNGGGIPSYEVGPEMGNYSKILEEKESKIEDMENVFISKIESLISTARQISNM